MLFGWVFLAIGVIGFFITGFDDFFAHHTGEKLLWFEINPAHNVVHLLFGIAGVLLSRSVMGAMRFGIVVGAGYGAALVYGLVAMNETWDFLSINAADNWLHLGLAGAGIALTLVATGELKAMGLDQFYTPVAAGEEPAERSEFVNDPGDGRAPDPNAAIIDRGTEPPAQGREQTDRDAASSLPPGAGTKSAGPRCDVDRAQPYDEQPIGLRMNEEPAPNDEERA